MPGTNTGKEGAVSAAVESLRKAMAESDKASLEKLAEEQLLYSHSSGRVENKAEFIATLVGPKSGFSAIDRRVSAGSKMTPTRRLKGESRVAAGSVADGGDAVLLSGPVVILAPSYCRSRSCRNSAGLHSGTEYGALKRSPDR